MTCEIIATGSRGNAVVINREILIDCGVPYKLLEPYVRDLRLVLLTHVHGDHFKPATVRRLHQERPALRFGACPWMLGPLVDAGVRSRVDAYFPGATHCYPGFTVKAERTVHDVPNCCYHIEMDGERIFYATDTGTLQGIEARWYDLYLVEANHTRAEIEARAAANHLSREQAAAWLTANAGPNSRFIYLHEHEED